jgi:murein DD-endopeptidase MepM/ murein hydrolase activator NlpD
MFWPARHRLTPVSVVVILLTALVLNTSGQNTAPLEAGSGGWFLDFPLSRTLYAHGAYTIGTTEIGINSVFDHEGRNSPAYEDDGRIVAFNGEYGDHAEGAGCILSGGDQLCYHPQGLDFSLEGLYSSRDFKQGRRLLSYSGHPGYDYRAAAGENVYASGNGVITNEPDAANTFYIDHGNGYRSYYLHTGTLSNGVWRRNNLTGAVTRGALIAHVGSSGTTAAHLHFEVRRQVCARATLDCWPRVDPYGWSGGCVDPYVDAASTTLWANGWVTRWEFDTPNHLQGWRPTNDASGVTAECFSVNSGIFFIDARPPLNAADPRTSDPGIVSPPLTNIDGSVFRSVHMRLASNSPDGRGRIYFATDASGLAFNEEQSVSFCVNNDGRFREITIDMSVNTHWSGPITAIRIDAAEAGRAGDDSVGFDYIELTDSAGNDGCGSALQVSPHTAPQGTTFTLSASNLLSGLVRIFIKKPNSTQWVPFDATADQFGVLVTSVPTTCSDPVGVYSLVVRDAAWLKGDFNGDGIVNSIDWSAMNQRWFTNDQFVDINADGIVNSIDFSNLNANWFRVGPVIASAFSVTAGASCGL